MNKKLVVDEFDEKNPKTKLYKGSQDLRPFKNNLIKIVSVTQSPRKTKRLRVVLNDNRYFDFGLKSGKTFLDHHDETKRQKNYLKRHLGNEKEKHLIDNLIPSPSLFSAFLLWYGKDLNKNIDELNKLFEDIHKKNI